jgi:FdhD protein
VQSNQIYANTYTNGKWDRNPINVIAEKAVTLSVNSVPWLTLMCTPNDLEALAVGFLLNEEIINSLKDIASVRVCPAGDNIDVWLNQLVEKPEKWTRTSGCSGGKTSVADSKDHNAGTHSNNGLLISPEKICDLTKQLSSAQELYRISGGVHTSAISDGEDIILVAEDIGRHNTLDKLEGLYLLKGISLERKLILTTGRVSSEMIQKANRMGAMMVISRTSPSSLSLEMAEGMGITLVGYARQDRFKVYSHPERILTITINEKNIREAA